MNDLTSRALELQHAAHELMYLGMDGEPVYSDTFCRLNKEVLVKCDSLFSAQCSDIEEEANLCLALLMGYNATIYDYGDKEQKKQVVLNRIYNVLEKLPASLFKARLLTYTYGEVYEEFLLKEAYVIIEGWDKDDLTPEQTEIIGELKNIEENPYPFEVVECNP
jgi:hypothetical protein